VPLGKGVPVERGRQMRVPPRKTRHFAAIGSYTVKTVADRYQVDANHNKQIRFINIDDLEWP